MTGDKEKARRLCALFLLGSILFGYPVISLFSQSAFIFGIPLLYFYVFSTWVVLILLIAGATRSGQTPGDRFPG